MLRSPPRTTAKVLALLLAIAPAAASAGNPSGRGTTRQDLRAAAAKRTGVKPATAPAIGASRIGRVAALAGQRIAGRTTTHQVLRTLGTDPLILAGMEGQAPIVIGRRVSYRAATWKRLERIELSTRGIVRITELQTGDREPTFESSRALSGAELATELETGEDFLAPSGASLTPEAIETLVRPTDVIARANRRSGAASFLAEAFADPGIRTALMGRGYVPIGTRDVLVSSSYETQHLNLHHDGFRLVRYDRQGRHIDSRRLQTDVAIDLMTHGPELHREREWVTEAGLEQQLAAAVAPR